MKIRYAWLVLGLAVLLVSCTTPKATPVPATSPTIVPPTAPPTSTPTFTPVPPTPIPTLGVGSKITGTDGMVLVYVPAGDFLMGGTTTLVEQLRQSASTKDSPLDWFMVKQDTSDDEPAHSVFLDAYWIDRTEVTIGQYKKCVASGGCAETAPQAGHNSDEYMPIYNNPDYAEHPVAYVNWEMASAYCLWAGRRLPTEAEWEKAARGSDGRMFPWGNFQTTENVNRPPLGCTSSTASSPYHPEGLAEPACALSQPGDWTTQAGAFPEGASPFGAFDMAGNVSEWVSDWYSPTYFASSPASNPGGPETGAVHVYRGSSFNSNPNDGELFITLRGHGSGVEKQNFWSSLGFRCASNP